MRCAWCGAPAAGVAIEIGDTQRNPSCGGLLHGIHFRAAEAAPQRQGQVDAEIAGPGRAA